MNTDQFYDVYFSLKTHMLDFRTEIRDKGSRNFHLGSFMGKEVSIAGKIIEDVNANRYTKKNQHVYKGCYS